MQHLNKLIIGACLFGFATAPSTAAQFTATSATLKSVFAAAAAGDRIILSGNFDGVSLFNRSFATRVTIDASRASFTNTVSITNVANLDFVGGTFGSTATTYQNGGTIRVNGGSGIRFLRPILIGDGAGRARGINFTETTRFTVDRGTFEGFRQAIGVGSSTRGMISNNRITKATSDGINIVSSQFVTARGNHCSNTIISLGAHPDCIQLWSKVGEPIQSDIKLLDNQAHGYTQGFTSFDPANASGLRIQISGNIVATSLPQGIACYGCTDSIITNNILTTLPEANHRTTIRVYYGTNNIVSGNSIGAFTKLPAVSQTMDGLVEASALSATVPEPTTWLQMILGLGLVGWTIRRRAGIARNGMTLDRVAA